MPAISARFTADVSDFRAKLATATTEVTGFQKTASQVNNELRKFGNEFSGANVIRAAESMAKAVNEIGGVTKLTESETKKLNAAVTEAIAKYEALGQQAPADLRSLKDETDKATQSAKGLGAGVKESEGSLLSFKGVAGTIGSVVAGAFTVSAVVGFAKSIVDLGGEIQDMSSRTKIGVEAVQELKYAAEQSGTSFDAVGSSIDQMSNRLAEGTKTTRAAVGDLGLSFSDLRRSSPEEAFAAITARIKEIPEPFRQTQLAMDLFGKSGTELLPAIREGFSDLRQQARDTGQVISEENVRALAAFGDKWDSTMSQIKASSATAVLEIGRGFGDLFSELRAGMDGLVPDGLVDFLNSPALKAFLEQAGRAVVAGVPGGGLVNLASDLRARGQQAAGQERLEKLRDEILGTRANTAGEGGGIDSDLVKHLQEVREKVASLTDATKLQIAAGNDLKQSEDDISKATGVNAEVIKLYNEELKKSEEQRKKLASLSLAGDFQETALKARELVKDIDAGRISLSNLGDKQDDVNKILRDGEQAMKALGDVGSPLYRRIVDLATATTDWGESFTKVKTGADDVVKAVKALPSNKIFNDIAFGDLGTELSNVKLGIGDIGLKADNADKQFKQWIDNSRANLKIFGTDFRDVFGDITADFSGHLAAMLTRQEGWKDGAVGIWRSLKDEVTDALGSILDYFINSFLKGITNALVGESGGWGQAFGNAFGGGGGGGGNVTGGVTNNLTNRAVNWGLGALGVGGVGTVAGTTSLAGVSGTASLAGGISGGSFTGVGAGAGAGAGGTFGGLSVAGVLGGAAAGGAGLGLGFLGQEIFGGAGWKAAGFGAGTGAAAGAAIGSVVPGIGTGIGAGVGALAGLIGGWIGQSVGEKVNDARDSFLLQKDDQGRAVFGGSGFGAGSAFTNLSTDLAKVQGGDKLFTNLLKADDFDELNRAVKRIVDTLAGAEFNTIKVREGFDALTQQREALLALGADENAVLESQAGSYSLLFDTIKKTGAEAPEALLPIFKSLIDMGLLVDENGGKVTSLADVAFGRLTAAASAFGTDTKAAFEEVSRQLDEFVEKGLLSAEQADEMRDKFKGLDEGAEAVGETADEVEGLTSKVIISRDRANELRQQLLEQQNAHTTIEGSEQRIRDLTDALRDAEQQAAEFQAALERAGSVPPPSAPTWDPSGGGASPALPGAAHGIYAWGPTPAVFGEGGEAELGGSVGFMTKALTGALREVSLDDLVRANSRGSSSSDRPIYLVADGMMLARVTNRYQPAALKLQGAIS